MTKMRDEKGRYVKTPDDGGWNVVMPVVVAALACAFGAMLVMAWPKPKVEPPSPVTVIEQGEPIDWSKVTVRAIPVEAWQDEHDKALLHQIEIRLQRVIDRNEARDTPVFPTHQ